MSRKKARRPRVLLTQATPGYYSVLGDAWVYCQSALKQGHSLLFHTDDLLLDGRVPPNDWIIYFPGAVNPPIQ